MIFNKSNPTIKTEGINEIDLETAQERRTFRILNVMLFFVLFIAIIISIDIVSVSLYNKKPYFAICMKTYNDGGTKVYYGLGYKVIKYNQKKGRQDTEIGFWTLPYNTDSKKFAILDLAIELRNYPQESYKKYIRKFLQVSGQVQEINEETITLRYNDESHKYSLDVKCHLAKKEKLDTALIPSSSAVVVGTVSNYTPQNTKDKNSINTLEMENCFIK